MTNPAGFAPLTDAKIGGHSRMLRVLCLNKSYRKFPVEVPVLDAAILDRRTGDIYRLFHTYNGDAYYAWEGLEPNRRDQTAYNHFIMIGTPPELRQAHSALTTNLV